MRLVRHLRLLVPAMVVGVLASCSAAPGEAASVNGTPIPRSAIEEAVRELSRDAGELSDVQREEQVAARQRNVLTMHVVAQVVRGLADERGVTIDDDDRAQVIAEVTETVGGEDQLEPAMRQADMTSTVFEDVFVEQQALIWAIRDRLTEGQDYETRTVRHILVETEEEADEVIDRLDDGEEFSVLARELSRDASTTGTGGDLGAAPRGAYVDAFDEAAWTAELDEVVGPVESELGFHVLEVLDESTTAASEVTADQRTRLAADEINELVVSALDAAEIEVDPGLGRWDPAQRAVVAAGEPVGQAPISAPTQDGGLPTPEIGGEPLPR